MNEPIYEQMQQLIQQIRQADTAYYKHDAPIMSDLEYDRLMDDLIALEEHSSVILSNSPTQYVAGETLETLTEVRHTKPMLSAAKTKSIDHLIRFASGRDVLLSWKMDGLTLVLRYENGHLTQAITRGRDGSCDWLCKMIDAEISRLRMVAISFSNLGICPIFANSSSKHRTWTGSRPPYSSSALSHKRLNSCV